MEFIEKNFLNTTTQMSITSGTLTVSNILFRDLQKQYSTDGFNDDATTASLVVTFDSTQTVSRLALMGHNLQSYTMFYNGVTANTFNMTTGSATTTTDFSTNSETSQYFTVNTVSVDSITIDMKETIVADSEKAIGWLVASNLKLDFERVPSSKNYKPKVNSKEVTHKMSDGSTRLNVIDRKMSANIKYKHASTTFKDSLKIIYDEMNDFIFIAFPTQTSWDEFAFPAIWDGPFDFFEVSDDSVQSGHSGSIKLKETS